MSELGESLSVGLRAASSRRRSHVHHAALTVCWSYSVTMSSRFAIAPLRSPSIAAKDGSWHELNTCAYHSLARFQAL